MNTTLTPGSQPPAPLNTAALPASPPPLLQPATPKARLNQEIAEALRHAHLLEADYDTNTVEEIAPTVGDLRCLGTDWNEDSRYFHVLKDAALACRTLDALKTQLSAERSFYHSLFRTQPGDTMHIYPTARAIFHDDWALPAIACVSGDTVYGYAGLESHGDTFLIKFIQSMCKMRAADQRKNLGGLWYEIFMERTIEAYANLHAVGVGLLLRTGQIFGKEYLLPRMVRDRYFTNQSLFNNCHPLNFNRARVKAIVARSFE